MGREELKQDSSVPRALVVLGLCLYNSNMSSNEPKVAPRTFDTYLSMVKNSIDSRTWQTVWVDIDGVKTDATEGGIKSCAFFVSSILKNFDFIKKTHATVGSTVKDLKESGWTSIESPKVGAVVVYEGVQFNDGEVDEHIAICASDTEAVSNSYIKKVPVIHSVEMEFNGNKRNILQILYNSKLLNN